MSAIKTIARMPWTARVVVLVTLAAVAALTALWSAPPVYATDPTSSLVCTTNFVNEGDSFRATVMFVNPNADWDSIYAFFTIEGGSADTSDYVDIRRRVDKDIRNTGNYIVTTTIETREDDVLEDHETFTLRYTHDELMPVGSNNGCEITIQDDDGPTGITSLEIISSPADAYAYRAGEEIEIVARFSREVDIKHPVLLPMRVGSRSDWWRGARLDREYEGEDRAYVFVYEVHPRDLDHNGISLDGGFTDSGGTTHSLAGSGWVRDKVTGQPIDTNFRGLGHDPVHRVIAVPSVTGIEILSSPANGEYYLPEENIDIAMTFDEDVEVEGGRFVGMRMGTGRDWWRGVWYDRGSGTDTLVFSYPVQAKDIDADGVSMDGGFTDENGTIHGFGGDGKIKSAASGAQVNPHYPRLDHQSAHKVGIPYIEDARITSSPAIGDTYGRGETIQVTVDFSRPVDVRGNISTVYDQSDVLLNLAMTTNAGGWRRADLVSGNGTDSLVFEYTVTRRIRGNGEFDDDGVNVGTPSGLFNLSGQGSIVAAGTDVDADLDWPESTSAPGHLVDGNVGARIASVEITSDPGSDRTYEEGDSIEVTVTFSASTGVSRNPSLALDFDGTEKIAGTVDYDGITYRFGYTVQAGDVDRNGIAIGANALNLNGGFIQDSWGEAVNVSHDAVPADRDHKVNAAGGL